MVYISKQKKNYNWVLSFKCLLTCVYRKVKSYQFENLNIINTITLLFCYI